MVTPERLTVLATAIQICDKNGSGAGSGNVAEPLGIEKWVATRELQPSIVGYVGGRQRGDDGVVWVRQSTAEARAFVCDSR